MAFDQKLEMDHEVIRGMGQDWQNMPHAMKQLKAYAAFDGGSPGDGLTPEHFGGTAKAAGAAHAFLGLMQDLDKSLGKAQSYTDAVATALVASAKATTGTDVNNALDLGESGKGL